MDMRAISRDECTSKPCSNRRIFARKNATVAFVGGVSSSLCHGEAVECAQGLLLGTLEPPLVSDLDLADPQLAAGHGSSDQLVTATLVTVSCRQQQGRANRTR